LLSFFANRSFSKEKHNSKNRTLLFFALNFNFSTKLFLNNVFARQLNDDAHDWERDLKMGHINAVGAKILGKIENPKLKTTSQHLKKIFWHDVVVGVCQDVLEHVQLAREMLEKVSVIEDSLLFEKLFDPVERSAQKALKERRETLKFLKTYGS